MSVVIPARNDAAELRQCLRRIAEQTRRPDEVIVVDNGSIDETATVARAAGAIVVRCDEPGIPPASAAGMDAATGELILRLDADCSPAPTWVADVAEGFRAHPDVDAFTGHATFIDGPRRLRGALAAAYLGGYTLAGFLALGHRPLFGSNLALRRTAWRAVRDRVHRHDGELHDDFDLSFHLGERHRIRALPAARMGISMRPFFDPRAMARRVRRGFRTVLTHWPRDFPPVRWTRLVMFRLRRRTRMLRDSSAHAGSDGAPPLLRPS